MENPCTEVPGHAQILAWVLKKSSVLITAQWLSYSGTKCERANF